MTGTDFFGNAMLGGLAIAFMACVPCMASSQPSGVAAAIESPRGVAVPRIVNPTVPMHGNPGGAGFTLTVHGWGFDPSAHIRWNGQALKTTVESAEIARSDVPAGLVARPGTNAIDVVNPGQLVSNSVYFPVSTPTWSIRTKSASITTPHPAAAIVAGDFNGDGNADIAVAGGNGLSIFLGHGDGSLTLGGTYTLCGQALDIVAGDFGHNGRTDLAVTDPACSPRVLVFEAHGDGSFTEVQHLNPGSPGGGRIAGDHMAVADMDGDGRLDLLVPSGRGRLSIFVGKPEGFFSSKRIDTDTSSGCRCDRKLAAGSVGVADFNHDGHLDVALVGLSYYAAVAFGNGDATFGRPAYYRVSGKRASSLLVADINADGEPDLITGSYQTPFFEPTHDSILFGSLSGTFSGVGQHSHNYNVAPAGSSSVLADFNGDNMIDFATALGNQIYIRRQATTDCASAPCFRLPIAIPLAQPALSMTAADLDNDGRLDLIVGHASSITMVTQLGGS